VIKKYCNEREYFYYRHWIKVKINCLAVKKNAVIIVILKDINDWQKMKNLVKLWNSNKRKEIIVIIRADWDRKTAKNIITVSEKSVKKEVVKKKNKFKY